ncbi:hypothetical protein RGQ29_016832 [Quercus rubra]|uniref:DYW domain-containing protein n=1 Tax=Quercus rubra TaxID=3512 RepID=A0AAN7FLE6_QUERU|nr:hypothetical protein RGQ29_016832 [Quercus rubra]
MGSWIHEYIKKVRLEHSTSLKNSLVEMYSKYVVSCNDMTQVLALHGLGEEALPQFHLMTRICIQPYDISFSGILSKTEMPMEPNGAIWGVVLREDAARHLLNLESENDGIYVFLSNIYESGKKNFRSERLEISYGLLKTQPGAKNLILKNLRVCSDCHSAFKLISKIYKRKHQLKLAPSNKD